jgi:hypothetical protein
VSGPGVAETSAETAFYEQQNFALKRITVKGNRIYFKVARDLKLYIDTV